MFDYQKKAYAELWGKPNSGAIAVPC